MGGSIATGVRALTEDVDGVLIIPGDMPLLTPEFLTAMIEHFERVPEPRSIIYPQSPACVQGNPVLWPQRFFAELAGLTGAAGGKSLLQRYADDSMPFPIADGPLLLDIDTPDDLVRAAAFLAARV